MSLMENLLKLHRVDSQVRGLRNRLDAAKRYHTHQSKQCSDAESQLAEQQTRRKQTQAMIANLEVETAAADEQIEKFRGDLNSSSTVKQYTAVQSEMNTVKERRGRIDEEILGHMEQVEAIEARIAEIQELVKERQTLREAAGVQLEERRGEVGTRLEELERDRAVAASNVPPAALAIFDELADIYDGEAMAPIEEIDRRHREYACGECNMIVPFENVVTLMRTMDQLVRCPACNRILFMQEEAAKV